MMFKEEQVENLINKQKLKDLALKLNRGVEIDWDNEKQVKYSIYLDNEIILSSYSLSCKELGQVYCLDVNFLDEAIELIGEDKLIQLIKDGE